MSEKKPSFISSQETAFKAFEALLAISLFILGGWTMRFGWDDPNLVGWIPSGALLLIGSMACACLIWRRHGTQRSTLLPLMFVQSSASLAEGILKWRTKEEGARWPMTLSILVVLMLAFMIVEEIHRRKQATRDAVFESTLPGTDDRVMAAQALARARLEVGNTNKYLLTAMVLMLLAGVSGLLSLAFQVEPQYFWPQLLISIVFLAVGFIHWRIRRTVNRMLASLRNLESP